MNKLFAKIATLTVGVAMAVGVGVAVSSNSKSFSPVEAASGDSYSFSTAAATSGTATDGNWSFSTGKNSGTDPAWNAKSGELRIYANNWIQFTAKSDYTLVSATFTIKSNQGGSGSGKAYPTGWSVDNGTISTYVGTDTEASVTNINASSFKITVAGAKGNVGFKSVVMNYTTSGSDIYTVTYYPNGATSGTAPIDSNTYESGDEITILSNTGSLARTGYVFSGWNTKADGSGSDRAPGSKWNIGGNVELYAKWTEDSLDSISVSGSLTKTDYYVGDDWDPAGLVVTADYESGASVDVTADASWTYNPASATSTSVSSVIATASFGGESASSSAQTVSVTDKPTYEYVETVLKEGELLITTSWDEETYYLPTDDATASGPKAVKFADVSEIDSVHLWNVSKDGDNWVFQNDDGNYMSVTSDSTNNGIRVNNTSGSWALQSDKSLKSSSYTRYLGIYNGADWRSYNSSTHTNYKESATSLKFYEQSSTPEVLESITITGSMTKTSYSLGESWDPTGFVVTANYESGKHTDVTSAASWTYDPASASATSITSVVATASFGGKSADSSAQSVTVTKANPIQVLYTQSAGASVDVYGYYVGFLDGTGPVIMNGEYGIVVYDKSADVSGYTEKETVLHVTGSITIYKGLYEVGSATISVASGTYEAPDAPVVYSTAGGETADKASRLTTVTGIPTLVSGNFDDAAGTNDIKMNFDLGGSKTVQVFYKKAAQTADADAFSAIKDAVANSDEITIKGFTGWYDGFQVQMNGYVPPAEDYTAEDFSQDLLDQTDEVCKDFVPGESSYGDFKVLLEAIWSDLASDDKYPSLPTAEKTKLAEAEREESGTVIEQAMARYDYLTGKYGLSNFINGRTPVAFATQVSPVSNNAVDSNSAMIIITVIALTSISSIAVLLVIKRRKAIR